MNGNSKIIIQNLIDTKSLDESFYLALLNAILEHRNQERKSKR